MELIKEIFWAIRGFTDDPALTTWVWLLAWAVGSLSGGRLAVSGSRDHLVWIFAALGLLLYPMALGLGSWDPYQNGYAPTWLAVLVAAGLLWCWLKGNTLGLLMLSLASLGFLLEIKPSVNFWDYLCDPFIVVYCWVRALRLGFASALGRFS